MLIILFGLILSIAAFVLVWMAHSFSVPSRMHLDERTIFFRTFILLFSLALTFTPLIFAISHTIFGVPSGLKAILATMIMVLSIFPLSFLIESLKGQGRTDNEIREVLLKKIKEIPDKTKDFEMLYPGRSDTLFFSTLASKEEEKQYYDAISKAVQFAEKESGLLAIKGHYKGQQKILFLNLKSPNIPYMELNADDISKIETGEFVYFELLRFLERE